MTDSFAARRAVAIEKLGTASALVLSAAPELVVGRDTELRYQADGELYYLSGYTEPEAVLVIAPANGAARFTLFVRPRDDARELWTGERGGIDAARERFGADEAYPIGELGERLPALLAAVDVIYARTGYGRPDVDSVIARVSAQARSVPAATLIAPRSSSLSCSLLCAVASIVGVVSP